VIDKLSFINTFQIKKVLDDLKYFCFTNWR